MLRPIDRSMVHHAAQTADGLIVLTRAIAEDYAPNVPAMVMEGIVSVESEEMAKTMPEPNGRPKEFVVLYTGALARIYGIPLLLDAFAELTGEDFRLWLFGRGDMAKDIRRRAEIDPRICLSERLVSSEELFMRCQQASVLINPRPTNESFARYSFPSNVLEYMAAGRPVVTTRLSAIPADYYPYLVWLDRETPEGLAALLRQLRERPLEELDDLGCRGRDFVLQEKNYRQQGRRVVEFIEHINSLAKGKG
jgi:glycosyltransferase involved in cell wall biosynthesis